MSRNGLSPRMQIKIDVQILTMWDKQSKMKHKTLSAHTTMQNSALETPNFHGISRGPQVTHPNPTQLIPNFGPPSGPCPSHSQSLSTKPIVMIFGPTRSTAVTCARRTWPPTPFSSRWLFIDDLLTAARASQPPHPSLSRHIQLADASAWKWTWHSLTELEKGRESRLVIFIDVARKSVRCSIKWLQLKLNLTVVLKLPSTPC